MTTCLPGWATWTCLDVDVPPQVYVYRWGPPYFGGARKGSLCVVLWRGGRNSALVQWKDGRRDIVSRNSLRRAAA